MIIIINKPIISASSSKCTIQQGCPDHWFRNQIWFLGKIYLVPLSFILCNAFWFRWVKRVQGNASTLEQYTLVPL